MSARFAFSPVRAAEPLHECSAETGSLPTRASISSYSSQKYLDEVRRQAEAEGKSGDSMVAHHQKNLNITGWDDVERRGQRLSDRRKLNILGFSTMELIQGVAKLDGVEHLAITTNSKLKTIRQIGPMPNL